MSRKLHDDMRLLEMASRSDPDDVLVLIKVKNDQGTGIVEIGASGDLLSRRVLLDILAAALKHVERSEHILESG
jgi:hypothetical protein